MEKVRNQTKPSYAAMHSQFVNKLWQVKPTADGTVGLIFYCFDFDK